MDNYEGPNMTLGDITTQRHIKGYRSAASADWIATKEKMIRKDQIKHKIEKQKLRKWKSTFDRISHSIQEKPIMFFKHRYEMGGTHNTPFIVLHHPCLMTPYQCQ
ncbi:hypothetical protein LPH56_11735 [Xylella taiwanensis]|uniref:Uncharacterized protein n=3 Tax=Xylella taiwanensis TaxID=1444770 RepID=Z9JHK3_9GAMM|nr:hypothetical protein [Xylella taiwanensis]AXI83662.1 hypothetical protein AB672_06820 [Xylella taiwanensis]EWS77232.1 hypothetical protein AF72_11975 [Xylella taiwanensis]MCD8459160.1 hypothetical protein [Xylella taiwanensis]MCD8474093.1 hypothetical protein [Xylella taiwanensis]UFS49573.1 hypothetical protein LPH54_11720 [Xylella taiwanensis]